MKLLLKIFILSLLAFAFGCVSKPYVADEYVRNLKGQTQTSKRTTVVFLIDGLPALTLKEGLQSGDLPALKKYFLKDKTQFQLARTPFPSLTFPGIGSLLTERPIHQHGIYGNHILSWGRQLTFEDPTHYRTLNNMIKGKTVFERLNEKGLKTAAINFNFNRGATTSMELLDLEMAQAVQENRYHDVDRKLIGSLKTLLDTTDVNVWPDFIFVHLVGVDFTSHDHGPDSKEVKNYLKFLDLELTPVFKKLEQTESKRQIVSLLTADHGYDNPVKKVLGLEKSLKNTDYRIKVLNEGRYAGIYFPKDWSEQKRSQLAQSLVAQKDIEIIAFENAGQITVQSTKKELRLSYSPKSCKSSSFGVSVTEVNSNILQAATPTPECPDSLNAFSNSHFYPFFISNLSYYFKTPGHPDMLIIPKSGVAFRSLYKGLHGGPTPQEVFVPLLVRGAKLKSLNGAPALWELLEFM